MISVVAMIDMYHQVRSKIAGLYELPNEKY